MIFLGHPSRILVTGPHRSGTTIATEIFAQIYGLDPIRESEIAHPRFEGDDEPDLSKNDVTRLCLGRDNFALQGATSFRWLPEIAWNFDIVVVVKRNTDDILASQYRYRGRYLDKPDEKYRECSRMNLPVPMIWVSYELQLATHPLFIHNREGWAPRQTA